LVADLHVDAPWVLPQNTPCILVWSYVSHRSYFYVKTTFFSLPRFRLPSPPNSRCIFPQVRIINDSWWDQDSREGE
jgi:hypothetical protein